MLKIREIPQKVAGGLGFNNWGRREKPYGLGSRGVCGLFSVGRGDTAGRFDQGNGGQARNRAILKYVSAYEFVHLKGQDFLNLLHSAGLSAVFSSIRPLAANLHASSLKDGTSP